jgi:hypothetical protein
VFLEGSCAAKRDAAIGDRLIGLRRIREVIQAHEHVDHAGDSSEMPMRREDRNLTGGATIALAQGKLT